LSIQHPTNVSKTYLFFDNVHLLKNVRNNLLNSKKFVFPAFNFTIRGDILKSAGGYIAWDDLKKFSKKTTNLRQT